MWEPSGIFPVGPHLMKILESTENWSLILSPCPAVWLISKKEESRDHFILEISSTMKTQKYTKFKNMAGLFCIH